MHPTGPDLPRPAPTCPLQLARLVDCAPPKDWALCWTVLPIIQHSSGGADAAAGGGGSSSKGGGGWGLPPSATSALKLRSPPPFATVLQHLQQVRGGVQPGLCVGWPLAQWPWAHPMPGGFMARFKPRFRLPARSWARARARWHLDRTLQTFCLYFTAGRGRGRGALASYLATHHEHCQCFAFNFCCCPPRACAAGRGRGRGRAGLVARCRPRHH